MERDQKGSMSDNKFSDALLGQSNALSGTHERRRAVPDFWAWVTLTAFLFAIVGYAAGAYVERANAETARQIKRIR